MPGLFAAEIESFLQHFFRDVAIPDICPNHVYFCIAEKPIKTNIGKLRDNQRFVRQPLCLSPLHRK